MSLDVSLDVFQTAVNISLDFFMKKDFIKGKGCIERNNLMTKTQFQLNDVYLIQVDL